VKLSVTIVDRRWGNVRDPLTIPDFPDWAAFEPAAPEDRERALATGTFRTEGSLDYATEPILTSKTRGTVTFPSTEGDVFGRLLRAQGQ